MRYCIEIAYKGTNFCGWQIQPNGISIQESIEKALSTILKQKIEIVGSSRTDAGVHAKQQFAHFDLENDLVETELNQLSYKSNSILSKDISIKKVFKVSDDFHSRFDATHRKYEYQILKSKNPFIYELAYFYRPDLEIELMNQAGLILTQHIDFQCFSKVHTDVKTFNCKIEFAYWESKDDLLVFHIQADRFLRGMVRAIVGTMIEVGANRLSIEQFEQIILSKDRRKAGRAVPAEGLTLVEVGYKSPSLPFPPR
jgi:tRNA pseudouridine38-40 synthase